MNDEPSSISSAFLWYRTREGDLYWQQAHLHSWYKTKGYHLCFYKRSPAMNEVKEIVVPEYEEAPWMEGARLEYMKRARDGIKEAFSWKDTEQGHAYWEEVYTKLYIMCKHMEIYSVFKRLSGNA